MSAASLRKTDVIDGNLASLLGSSATLVDGVTKVQLGQAGKASKLHSSRLRNSQACPKNMRSVQNLRDGLLSFVGYRLCSLVTNAKTLWVDGKKEPEAGYYLKRGLETG